MASSRGEVKIMPQDMVSSPYTPQMDTPQKRCCEKCRIGLARAYILRVRHCLCALCNWFFSLGPSKEPAMNGTSGFPAGCGKTISSQQNFDGLHIWTRGEYLPQDAQKGRSARPQQAKRRCVLCSVRGASERSENAAGGLFQHPARAWVRSRIVVLPHTSLVPDVPYTTDRKSTRLNSSHIQKSRMPSSA